MRVLGIDPGTVVTGYGIIESRGTNNTLVEYGCIKTNSKSKLPRRLSNIYKGLTEIIKGKGIDAIGIEEAFYAKNVKTTLILGHARGVILLAAENTNIDIHEYSPREVKKSVTGNGAASKEQVQYMVQRILNIPQKIEPLDASDALAVAICLTYRMKIEDL